jgi:hypothetical protein
MKRAIVALATLLAAIGLSVAAAQPADAGVKSSSANGIRANGI